MAEAFTRDGIRSALAGDKLALRALVDGLTPIIQARTARVLLRTGGRGRRGDIRQEVEDLAQEVFERLFDQGGKTLLTWDHERGLTLLQYVGMISEREVISILRSKRRSPYTERPTEEGQLEESAHHDDAFEAQLLTRQMATALFARLRTTLSPLGFRVFELLFCHEHSPEAVGRELGMTADAVYAWRSRIRKTARQLVEELGDGAVS
jgi:RNA polymerase sigma-70 factor (ECF subfamily)